MIKVDHAGFVRFDNLRHSGKVVAQYPVLPHFLGQTVTLQVPAEKELLDSDEPLVVNDVAQAEGLGNVQSLLLAFNIQSVCIVTVKLHGVVIGSFGLDSIGRQHNFSPEDIAFCKAVARLASKTIENAQLVDWLEAFQNATVAITSERDAAPLLKTIVKQANLLFGAGSVGLYQRCPDDLGQDSLRLTASSDDDLIDRILPKGQGMAWQLIDGSDPFLTTSDYATYEHRSALYEGRFGSVLEVPLVRQSERVGVIYLSDARDRTFTEFDARLLQRFADMVTLALQHCNLVARLNAISTSTADISGDLDSKTLYGRLTAIARHTTTILHAEVCGVFSVEDFGHLKLQASYGHAEGRFERDRVFEIKDEPHSGLTGAIAAQLIEDHAKRASFPPRASVAADLREAVFNKCGKGVSSHPAIKGEGTAEPSGKCYSVLAIPLVKKSGVHEVVSGMLRISNKKGTDGRPHESICFNEEDEWVLRIFAEAVVVAIESAKLFDELRLQKEHYGLLLDVWNTLAGDEPIEDRLSKIAQSVVGIARKSFCRILLAEESEDFLTLKAAELHSDHEKAVRWNPLGRERTPISDWPLLEQALKDGQPYELCSPDATLKRLADLLELRAANTGDPLPIEALFAVPLKVGTRPVGLLSVGEMRRLERERGAFSTEDRNLVSAIANQASVMIDREWRGHTMKRRAELLSRLPEALAVIGTAADEEGKNFAVIAEQTRLVFGCKEAGFLLDRGLKRPVELITASGKEFLAASTGTEEEELFELLFSETLIGPAEISAKFASAAHRLPALSALDMKVSLAVRFEYAVRARFILFVGDPENSGQLISADLGVLERLANHCAASLTKTAASNQLKRARDGVNRLALGLALGDQRDALENVVAGILSATDCDVVVLYRTRISDGKIVAAATTTPTLLHPSLNVRPGADSAVARILKLNRPYSAEDAPGDPVLGGKFVEREEIRSSMGTPILLKDVHSGHKEEEATAGVLFVNYRRYHEFTDEDLKIIGMFAHLSAIAIRNQDLFERKSRQARTEQALRATAAALTETRDLGEAVKRVAEEAHRLAIAGGQAVTCVAIVLFEDEMLPRLATWPPDSLNILGPRLRQAMSPSTDCDGSLATVLLTDVPRLAIDISENRAAFPTLRGDTESQLVVPVSHGHQQLGVICVESSDGSGLTEDDKETFVLFAAIASEAIQSRQREDKLRDLAIFYIRSGLFVHKHRARVRNFIKDAEFLVYEAAKAGITGGLREAFANFASGAGKFADLLDSTSADFHALPVLLLNETLTSWRDLLMEDDAKKVFLQTSATTNVRVRIDESLMHEVYNIFFTNALKAMEDTVSRRFIVDTSIHTDGRVQISFKDTGKGIDRDTLDRIRRGVQVGGGRGYGLWTASLIVTKLGGDIMTPTTSADGTIFTIVLPQAEDKEATDDDRTPGR